MKESVLDVLIYLFEHYSEDDIEVGVDRDVLNRELVDAGFGEMQVERAFDWLEELAADPDSESFAGAGRPSSVRVFVAEELERLDLECRSFLLFLEQVGVLDTGTRERVIERVMALGPGRIDLESLKWVVLMVLSNHPGRESMVTWMEDFVFGREATRLH